MPQKDIGWKCHFHIVSSYRHSSIFDFLSFVMKMVCINYREESSEDKALTPTTFGMLRRILDKRLLKYELKEKWHILFLEIYQIVNFVEGRR